MSEPRSAQVAARAPRYSRDQAEFDRAIAFIDATFAVALTLLITGLDVSDPSTAFRSLSDLADAVGAQFISFVIAFTVIASYWLMHHRMVASFVALDTANIVTNLFLLATIVLLPFSTASVGDPSTAELPLATALMAANVAAVSSLYTVVWVMGSRRDLLDHRPTSGEWRQRVVAGLAPAAVFLASIPVAYLVSPDLARLSWLALLVVNPAVAKLAAPSARTRAEG
jgi:TMEM175 potassium channel family protein